MKLYISSLFEIIEAVKTCFTVIFKEISQGIQYIMATYEQWLATFINLCGWPQQVKLWSRQSQIYMPCIIFHTLTNFSQTISLNMFITSSKIHFYRKKVQQCLHLGFAVTCYFFKIFINWSNILKYFNLDYIQQGQEGIQQFMYKTRLNFLTNCMTEAIY